MDHRFLVSPCRVFTQIQAWVIVKCASVNVSSDTLVCDTWLADNQNSSHVDKLNLAWQVILQTWNSYVKLEQLSMLGCCVGGSNIMHLDVVRHGSFSAQTNVFQAKLVQLCNLRINVALCSDSKTFS